jgi:hypothetical protein
MEMAIQTNAFVLFGWKQSEYIGRNTGLC